MERIKTGGWRRHEMLYSLDTGRLMGGPFSQPSMGNKGTAYDNAVAESFFSNLKNELLHHCIFTTREDARAAIFGYIELFYNRQRIHQSLGYLSPEKFEERMVCLD